MKNKIKKDLLISLEKLYEAKSLIRGVNYIIEDEYYTALYHIRLDIENTIEKLKYFIIAHSELMKKDELEFYIKEKIWKKLQKKI